ncbi:hypothetical protein UFOVP671_28 [uncultured Caudovirales phage]|uniref:Uncharacterized protein n=1 Tax=uncultured Caudovirales phage TaxID=2100421 RepID=A0A6J5NAQ1_9CAUD|nr:hypothetical protein UFOVP671_28 [uncultured Caudovirales phage]
MEKYIENIGYLIVLSVLYVLKIFYSAFNVIALALSIIIYMPSIVLAILIGVLKGIFIRRLKK